MDTHEELRTPEELYREGLCPMCGAANAVPGDVFCAPCAILADEDEDALYAEREAAGTLPPFPSSAFIMEHRVRALNIERRRLAQQAWREQRRLRQLALEAQA